MLYYNCYNILLYKIVLPLLYEYMIYKIKMFVMQRICCTSKETYITCTYKKKNVFTLYMYGLNGIE